MNELLTMDGYGIYVWSCFALTFGIVLLNEWLARRQHRRELNDVRVRIRAMEEKP